MASINTIKYGGSQADYLQRKGKAIGRAVQMIPTASFDEILDMCAEVRSTIAKLHGSIDADDFGKRRDDGNLDVAASMTLLDRDYTEYGKKALQQLSTYQAEVLDTSDKKLFAVYEDLDRAYPPRERYTQLAKGNLLKIYDFETHFISWTATMKIEGEVLPLSQYLSWVVYSPEKVFEKEMLEHSKVAIIHQDRSLIKGMLKDISLLFEEAVRWSGELDELMEIMAIFRFEFSHCMPFHRGSAAIAEWLETAIYRYHGFEDFSYNVQVDLEALTSSFNEFLSNYPSMIHGLDSIN